MYLQPPLLRLCSVAISLQKSHFDHNPSATPQTLERFYPFQKPCSQILSTPPVSAQSPHHFLLIADSKITIVVELPHSLLSFPIIYCAAAVPFCMTINSAYTLRPPVLARYLNILFAHGDCLQLTP